MILKHCRELVTPQDARAWFAIKPEAIKKLKGPSRTGQSRPAVVSSGETMAGKKQKARQERQANVVAFPGAAAA